jgi:polar amino acid transport system substrate-binding protein
MFQDKVKIFRREAVKCRFRQVGGEPWQTGVIDWFNHKARQTLAKCKLSTGILQLNQLRLFGLSQGIKILKVARLSNTFLRLFAILVTTLTWWANLTLPLSAEPFPKYRNTAREGQRPVDVSGMRIRLLADSSFPPFSYQGSDGLQKGIAIDLARLACQKLEVTCEIRMWPFEQLMTSLVRGDGDAIISGLRPQTELASKAHLTAPYYVSTGSFVTKRGRKIKDTTTRELAGKPVGVVRGTVHEAFLQKYYPKIGIKTYNTALSLLKDVQNGVIDAAFGDTMQIAFWMKGSDSAECCEALGKPFVDRETISRGLVFVLARDRSALRQAFDSALDQLEDEGKTAEVFGRYVPAPLW